MVIVTEKDIAKLGTILGIWAHPDDELFCMGGIMAAAAQNGQLIACVTATRGEAGVQDEVRWPAANLANIRTRELEDAYNILGVTDHRWLDYPDGGCADIDQNQAVTELAEIIEHYQPDTIMTFGLDGLTGHPDHQTVSHWSKLALDKSRIRANLYHNVQTTSQYEALREADAALDIFFNIDKPKTCEDSQCDILFRLSDGQYATKMAALKAMPSQTEKMLSLFGGQLREGFGTEAFVLWTSRSDLPHSPGR